MKNRIWMLGYVAVSAAIGCGGMTGANDAASDAAVTNDAVSDGESTDAGVDVVGSDGASSCDPGSAPSASGCQRCSAGQYCAGGDAAATTCSSAFDDDNDPATACRPWSECAAGTFASAAGTTTRDRTCTPCDAGTFSVNPNSGSCTAWTTCAPGTAQDMPGSSTHDRTCVLSARWIRQFGSVQTDSASAVATDTNGNTVVVGKAGTLPGQTTGGPFIRAYDANGTETWTRELGLGTTGEVGSVRIDASGNVYIAGWISGTLPGQTRVGDTDAFVRKYSSTGTELWTRQFGTTVSDIASAVTTDAAGNVYVAGSTFGRFAGQTSTGHSDPYVRKYDAAGTALWTQQWGGAGGEALAITADAAGNVYVAGNINGTIPGGTSAGLFDAYVRKFDTAGTALWSRQFGSRSDDFAYGLGVDASDNLYIAGYTSGALPGANSAGGYDAFVRRYDSAGTETWTRQFGTSGADKAYALAVDATSVSVVGSTAGTFAGQTSLMGTDAFVRRYALDGTSASVLQFGSNQDDFANGAAVDASGHLFVAGGTGGTLPSQTSAGGIDAFVLRLDL